MWSLSVGRVSSGLLQPLRPATPAAFPRLSASQSFATKASNQRGKAKFHPARTAKQVPFRNENSQHPTSETAGVHTAPARVPRPPMMPASETAGTPRNPATMQPNNKMPPSTSSQPQSVVFQNNSPVNKQSTSSADSVHDADHERRQSSLPGNASTSAAAPSLAASSGYKGKPSSQAARKTQYGPRPVAASSTGATAVKWGAAARDPRTSPAQPADSSSSLKRPGPPLPRPLPAGPPAASPPPAPPDHTTASESPTGLKTGIHSPTPSPPQQSTTNPSTASLGGNQTRPTPGGAGTNSAVQTGLQVSSPIAAAHVEPSMYAQKAVPFDVSASSRIGATAIRDLLETQKITLHEYAPGQKPKVLCPRCLGGSQHEASLAVNISVDSQSAAWLCHRATCGWQGAIDQKTGTWAPWTVVKHCVHGHVMLSGSMLMRCVPCMPASS